jgi:hypothetical protein
VAPGGYLRRRSLRFACSVYNKEVSDNDSNHEVFNKEETVNVLPNNLGFIGVLDTAGFFLDSRTVIYLYCKAEEDADWV